MTDSDVRIDKTGPVARIAVNRPERLNAYRNETADDLRAALAEAEADPPSLPDPVTGCRPSTKSS